jgi:hypothetical protein
MHIRNTNGITLLETLVAHVGTPSSSTASDSTCIWNMTSTYPVVYRKSPSYT